MASLVIDTESVATTGTRLAAASAQAPPPGVVITAPAADPVSTATATVLQARAAGIDAYSSAGARIAAARGEQLGFSAAAYAAQEVANAAALGGGGVGGPGAAPQAPSLIPVPPVAPPSAPTVGPPPGRGRDIAALVHAGPGTGSLRAAAQQLHTHAAELRALGGHVTGSAGDVSSAWASDAGAMAADRVGRLGSWFDEHAQHADAAASAVASHAESFDQLKAAMPTPAQFTAVENKLQQAAAANANPATLGRYAPVVTALQTQLATMNTQAVTQYASYASRAGESSLTGRPPSPPPQPGVATGPDDTIVGPARPGDASVTPVDWKTGPAIPNPEPNPGAQPQIGPFPVPPQVAAHAPNIVPRPLDPTGGLLTPQDLPPATPPPRIPGVTVAGPGPSVGPAPAAPAAPAAAAAPGCDFGDWSKASAEVIFGPMAILTAAPEGATGVGIPVALGQIGLGYAAAVDGLQVIEKCTG